MAYPDISLTGDGKLLVELSASTRIQLDGVFGFDRQDESTIMFWGDKPDTYISLANNPDGKGEAEVQFGNSYVKFLRNEFDIGNLQERAEGAGLEPKTEEEYRAQFDAPVAGPVARPPGDEPMEGGRRKTRARKTKRRKTLRRK